MIISLRDKHLLSYSAKCVLGISLCALVSIFLAAGSMTLESHLGSLVLSPAGTDVLQRSLTRIKANLVGAAVGIPILLLLVPAPWNMAVAAAVSLYVCDRLGPKPSARSTLAATIIILLRPEGAHPWDAALNRVLAVATGCLLGLGITYEFHYLVEVGTSAVNSGSINKDSGGLRPSFLTLTQRCKWVASSSGQTKLPMYREPWG